MPDMAEGKKDEKNSKIIQKLLDNCSNRQYNRLC